MNTINFDDSSFSYFLLTLGAQNENGYNALLARTKELAVNVNHGGQRKLVVNA